MTAPAFSEERVPAPEISVVVPVYKAAREHLERCVRSVLSQDFSNFELILVDDGSPDSCGEICDGLAGTDSRIRVLHQENKGAAKARGAGVRIARGEWIAFVDSDDYLLPGALNALLLATKKSSEIDLVEGCFVRDKKMRRQFAFACDGAAEFAKYLDAHGRFLFDCASGGSLIRRNLFEQADAFAVPRWLVMGEDWAMFVLLAPHIRRAVKIKNPVYFYTVNENGAVESFGRSKWGADSKYFFCRALLIRKYLIRGFGEKKGNEIFFCLTRIDFLRRVAKRLEKDPFVLRRWAQKYAAVENLDFVARFGIFTAKIPRERRLFRKICSRLLRRLLRADSALRKLRERAPR